MKSHGQNTSLLRMISKLREKVKLKIDD